QEVLRHWAGLGYYSRARNLRAAARRIVAACEGEIPPRVSGLLFLPGVGRYIAGAVASIAFGVSAPAVDSNVVRVICRLFALDENPASAPVRRGLEELVSRLIPASRPGDFNQALMELGARICAPAPPRCRECPLRASCEGARRGNPRAYPAPPRRPAIETVEEASAVVRADGKCFVVCQRAASGRYRNLWQFPHVEVAGEEEASRALQRHLREAFHLCVRVLQEWAEVRYQVTHHRIRKRVYLCAPARKPRAGPRLPKGLSEETARWATVQEIGSLPLGAPDKRILDLIAEGEDLFMV
ncbi:MAG TPA: NUDIX domain-containing protein, partial [Sumerlaeia bacterium]|nr:NUDIX domain-containing protein [Sumerlaeia bacterium]